MGILLLISGGDSGGAKTHVLSLLRSSAGLPVALAALGDGPLVREAREQGFACTLLPGGFWAQLRAVQALCRDGDLRILHCHGSRANLIGALLKGRIGSRVVTTIHSDHRLDYLGRPWARFAYGMLNSLALRRMDALICVSEAMRETYENRGFPQDRLYSVFNGADLSLPRHSAQRLTWFAERGFFPAASDVIVGTAARLNPVKDLGTLLRGFAGAAKDCPRLCLALAGSGPEEKRLRTLAETLGVAERVFFLGWLEDTEDFYACIDIVALSSLSETFPYALTDAARYGLPVVATPVGGVSELIQDGQTGLCFPCGDAAALSAHLVRLGEDPALRRRLGAALGKRTREHFSLTAMGDRQEKIYRELGYPRRGVVISGAYGLGNIGDELMLTAMTNTIRALDDQAFVTVLSRHRENWDRRQVGNLFFLNLPAIWRRLRRARIFLSGGGNLLQDVTSRRSLLYYLLILRLARRAGCRVLLYGAGLGPLSPWGEKITGRVLRRDVDALLLRDRASFQLAEQMGVSPSKFTPFTDPAWATPLPPKAEGEPPYLLFFPRNWPDTGETVRLLLEELEALARARSWRLVIAAMNPREDGKLVAALSEDGKRFPTPTIGERDLPALVVNAELVISLRLHALVLAMASGTPCGGIDCDGRIGHFLAGRGAFADIASLRDPCQIRSFLALAGQPRPNVEGDRQRMDALHSRGIETLKEELLRLDN